MRLYCAATNTKERVQHNARPQPTREKTLYYVPSPKRSDDGVTAIIIMMTVNNYFQCDGYNNNDDSEQLFSVFLYLSVFSSCGRGP